MGKYIFVIFNILVFSINSFAQKNDLLSFMPKGYVKDGSVDYTDIVQTYLDNNKRVVLPNFAVLINDKGLVLRSNQELIFQESSKLLMKKTNKSNYSLLILKNVNNVTINNVFLEGDRYRHIGDKGEWGMGIKIENSQNISIINRKTYNFWGDGIYITGIKTNNINISGGVLEGNRRNGISIISGNNININNIKIQNTKGVWPMSAIDIEPNSRNTDFLGNILLENITTYNNPRGISIVLNNYLSTQNDNINIITKNFKSINDEISIKINPLVKQYIKGIRVKTLGGSVKFENVNIERSKRHILIKGDKGEYELAPIFVFENIKTDTKKNFKSQFDNLNKKKFKLK